MSYRNPYREQSRWEKEESIIGAIASIVGVIGIAMMFGFMFAYAF